MRSNLPRLAYVGDVDVGDFGNGPKLLKCLFEDYPPENLRLLVSDFWDWPAGERLHDVVANTFPLRWRRLRLGRLYELMSTHCLLSSEYVASRLAPLLTAFRVQSIVTVTAGPSWLTAAYIARRLNVPLHLILHDHLPTQCAVHPLFAKWMQRRFGEVYRQARSRLCVSPSMEELYSRDFGVSGTVLYPSRSVRDPTAKVADTSAREQEPFTVLYAGTLAPKPYVEMLGQLAVVLEQLGGRLVIYSFTIKDRQHLGSLRRANVELRDSVSSTDLKRRLPAEADVLFVPMSFAREDEVNMRISFPSKLADYTSTGLPLFIWGPAYCSAVRWSKEFPGAAAVVDSTDGLMLMTTVRRLMVESRWRRSLAEGAVAAGEHCFSHAAASRVFYDALCR